VSFLDSKNIDGSALNHATLKSFLGTMHGENDGFLLSGAAYAIDPGYLQNVP
jgi:hypothetical protein